jgi:uncharacterized protein
VKNRGGWLPGLITLAAIVLLTGCGSSPNPVMYTIEPVWGVQHRGGPQTIVLEQIGLARYLERSQIVQSSDYYRLSMLANDWWGEPLGDMLSRTLVAELQQRLAPAVVVSETGSVSATAGATVSVNIQRLDEDATGMLVLEAQFGVAFHGRSSPVLRNVRFVAAPPAQGVPGEVAAISTVVGQLSDAIAATVVAGPTS